jgi:hypothetical protein
MAERPPIEQVDGGGSSPELLADGKGGKPRTVLLSGCWGLLRYQETFDIVITTTCCESNPLVSHPCLKLSYHMFPALVE